MSSLTECKDAAGNGQGTSTIIPEGARYLRIPITAALNTVPGAYEPSIAVLVGNALSPLAVEPLPQNPPSRVAAAGCLPAIPAKGRHSGRCRTVVCREVRRVQRGRPASAAKSTKPSGGSRAFAGYPSEGGDVVAGVGGSFTTESTKSSAGNGCLLVIPAKGATFGSMPNRRLPRSPPSPARQASLCREIHQAEWRQPGVCWISQRRRRCRGRCRTVVCREVRRVQRGRPASDTKSA